MQPFISMLTTFGFVIGLLVGQAPSARAAAPVVLPLRVVATVPALGRIVKEVGGEHVSVQAMAAASEDPHFVDAKPNFILLLNRAHLLVATGLDLEIGWLPTLLVSARNGKIQPGGPGYFEASRLVQLLEAPQGRIDRAMGDIHPGGNPHFLTDPMRVGQIALGIAVRLGELDPAHAELFGTRAKALSTRLSAVRDAQAARFLALPAAARQVVTYHRSFSYLLAWLALNEVATLEPRPGVAPDPGHVAGVLSRMRRDKVRAVLQEEFYPTSTSKTLCQLAHAKLVVVPGGASLAGNQDLVGFFDTLANQIFTAL